jgi:hypothetical protein
VLAANGDAVMVNCRFSPCGKYFAYAISHLVGDHIPTCHTHIDTFAQGGDFATIYVRPTTSPLSQATTAEGEDGRFPDEVKWFKFSAITWTKDSKGFLYQVYDAFSLPYQMVIFINEGFTAFSCS